MFIINLVKGFIIGIAFVIPGVSGGTLAVYLGVYQKLIDSIGNIIKDFKNSFKFLLPIFLGIGISIVLIAKLVEILLNWNSFIVLFFFIGLIAGGVRFIYEKAKVDKFSISILLSGLLAFALLVSIVLLEKSSTGSVITSFDFSFGTYLLIFGLGIVTSITMIVPGISGSAVLLVLGYYTAIVSNVVGNITDLQAFSYNIQVLIPFAFGALVGVIVFSKIIGFFLEKYPKQTYFAILGFIVSSILGIFLEIKDHNTQETFSDQTSIFDDILVFIGDNIWTVVGGLIALLAGFIVSKYMTKFEGKNNDNES
ncbi:MAG: DUF368 domain-containing protein [Candidatus Izemoplasmatales bacterium]|nr:DUF368 domain-containing protein [Candidatus Izemoplasmatales bacterium]